MAEKRPGIPDLEDYRPVVLTGKIAIALRQSAKDMGVSPEHYLEKVIARWATLENMPEDEFVVFMRGGTDARTNANRTADSSGGTPTGTAAPANASNGRTRRKPG